LIPLRILGAFGGPLDPEPHPESGADGRGPHRLEELLRPLVRDEGCVGFSVGCYNPDKDPGGANGDALTGLFRDALAG